MSTHSGHMIDSWDLYLQAEEKSARAIRTYLEAGRRLSPLRRESRSAKSRTRSWVVAVSRRSRAVSRRRMPTWQGDAGCSQLPDVESATAPDDHPQVDAGKSVMSPISRVGDAMGGIHRRGRAWNSHVL